MKKEISYYETLNYLLSEYQGYYEWAYRKALYNYVSYYNGDESCAAYNSQILYIAYNKGLKCLKREYINVSKHRASFEASNYINGLLENWERNGWYDLDEVEELENDLIKIIKIRGIY